MDDRKKEGGAATGPCVRPLAFAVVLLIMGLVAGCSAPPGEEEVLLQVTERIGDELYVWADPDFTGARDEVRNSTVSADLSVPQDIERVGVSFAGEFRRPANGSATFAIHYANGSTLFRLAAAPGSSDDDGVIGRFWRFDRAIGIPPGTYGLKMTGSGDIGYVDFTVHSIPEGPTAIEDTFQVPRDDVPLRVEVFLRGWGAVPQVRLVGPTGQEDPVALVEADDQATLTVPGPREGEYRLVADTTDWGGRFIARATQG